MKNEFPLFVVEAPTSQYALFECGKDALRLWHISGLSACYTKGTKIQFQVVGNQIQDHIFSFSKVFLVVHKVNSSYFKEEGILLRQSLELGKWRSTLRY